MYLRSCHGEVRLMPRTLQGLASFQLSQWDVLIGEWYTICTFVLVDMSPCPGQLTYFSSSYGNSRRTICNSFSMTMVPQKWNETGSNLETWLNADQDSYAKSATKFSQGKMIGCARGRRPPHKSESWRNVSRVPQLTSCLEKAPCTRIRLGCMDGMLCYLANVSLKLQNWGWNVLLNL